MPKKKFLGVVLIGLGVLLGLERREQPVRRVGMVIGIKPEKIPAYKALHADSNPGVRDLLSKYHMRNFSIFLRELEHGKTYLFGYYEYDGTDYEGDMKRLSAEQRNKAWLAVTDEMQLPLPGQSGWAPMEQVYYNK
ncbi:MAG: L-rhamnose mutarotase [Bryobacteraceae bacterium]